jgi:hypothetical protein
MTDETIQDLAHLIGQPCTITADGLTIPCTIRFVRQVFGRTELLIAPVHGSGERWLTKENVTLTTPEGG